MAKAPSKAKAPKAAKATPDAPDREAPEPTTRAEAEALIRSMRRTCLGPRHAPSHDRWSQLMAAGKVDEARTVQTRGIPQPGGVLVPCGYDFNETILATPFDGQDHEATCPRCGTVTSFRAPSFPALRRAS